MMKRNLFAAQEREAKLTKLDDTLQVLERHIDFAALADAVDTAAPRPAANAAGDRHFLPK